MNMLSIQNPIDLVSISLYNVLSYRKDEEFYNLVNNWNKTIIIDIKELYPVAVMFQGEDIRFEALQRGEKRKADLRVTMDIQTMLDIANGRTRAIISVLKGKIRIKGMLKVGVLLKFMKVFLKSMKMVAADPETRYYEKEKVKR